MFFTNAWIKNAPKVSLKSNDKMYVKRYQEMVINHVCNGRRGTRIKRFIEWQAPDSNIVSSRHCGLC